MIILLLLFLLLFHYWFLLWPLLYFLHFSLLILSQISHFLHNLFLNQLFYLLAYIFKSLLFNKNIPLIWTQIHIYLIWLNFDIQKEHIFCVWVVFFIITVKYLAYLFQWIYWPTVDKCILQVFWKFQVLFWTTALYCVQYETFNIFTFNKY